MQCSAEDKEARKLQQQEAQKKIGRTKKFGEGKTPQRTRRLENPSDAQGSFCKKMNKLGAGISDFENK